MRMKKNRIQPIAEPVQEDTIPEAVAVTAEVQDDEAGPRTTYKATEKSARMLKQLLNAKNGHSSSGELGSLLNDLLEDTNEAK